MASFPQSVSWGHLGTFSEAQFALMLPATYVGRQFAVDNGAGTLTQYTSNGLEFVSWLAPGSTLIASGVVNDSDTPAAGANLAEVTDYFANNLNTLVGTQKSVTVTSGPGPNQITLGLDPAGLNIPGCVDASVAAAGYVGERLSNSIAAVALVSSTATTIVSLALTAGSWDVNGTAIYKDSADAQPFTALVTYVATSIGTVTNTLPIDPWTATDVRTATAPSVNMKHISPTRPFDISVPATAYLVVASTFAGGAIKVDGYISARRMR